MATVSLSPEKIITRLVLVFILISKACGRELKYLITINISLHDRMEDIMPLVTEWVYCHSSTRVRGRWRPHHRTWDSGEQGVDEGTEEKRSEGHTHEVAGKCRARSLLLSQKLNFGDGRHVSGDF